MPSNLFDAVFFGLLIFAAIGAYYVGKHILRPILISLALSIGYTIAHIKVYRASGKHIPFLTRLKLTFLWLIDGFFEGDCIDMTIGHSLVWTPYFNYKWIADPAEIISNLEEKND